MMSVSLRVPVPEVAPSALTVVGPQHPCFEAVLTPRALDFVADLVHVFQPRLDELLARRRERQARFDAGERPDFLLETASVRAADWRVAPFPKDLEDRRV